VRSARIANAEEFILQFPDGFDTVVGDRGIRLSGGQRQRIAIARAVYGHPEILILDEATSSLDSESEQQVQAAMDRVIEGITAVVIAHRLSTIMKADKIVVLNQGRIEAIGSHQELISGSELYRRLYTSQFLAGAEDAKAER
jgi:ABC-type multidrug transport system fused ATPase/permease subunit